MILRMARPKGRWVRGVACSCKIDPSSSPSPSSSSPTSSRCRGTASAQLGGVQEGAGDGSSCSARDPLGNHTESSWTRGRCRACIGGSLELEFMQNFSADKAAVPQIAVGRFVSAVLRELLSAPFGKLLLGSERNLQRLIRTGRRFVGLRSGEPRMVSRPGSPLRWG